MEITAEAIESATVIGPNGAFTKCCEWCCQPLVRHPKEDNYHYRKRKCCCRDCADKFRRGKYRPRGDGRYLQEGGYTRVWVNGKYPLEHDHLWEQAHGPIPEGYEVHHIDGNKANNSLDNLQLMSHNEHRRLHMSMRKRDALGRMVSCH